jgi:K+-transporting ATPase ATPase C chain
MLKDFTTALRPAIVLTLHFAVLLGLVYPAAITGIGQLLAPAAANGNLIRSPKGQVIGSSLIGQSFTSDAYFHGRPSAAGKNGYDATASSGSNLGPTSQALVDRVKTDLTTAKASAPGNNVPADLVTASASGLDPDISPEAALFQVGRVAKARRMAPDKLKALVTTNTDQPLLGFLGERRVNVLRLNLALDRIASRP